MKVLQVSTHVNIGGIGNYILTLSGALISKGYSVTVASSGGNLLKEFATRGIEARNININTKNELSPKVIIAAFQIAKIIKDENIDIIHAHSRVSQVAASIASFMTGIPYVTTCHGYFKKRLRGVLDTWGRITIAISAAVKTHLIDDLGVKEGRVRLVYNGVDVQKFAVYSGPSELKVIRSSLGLKDGPVIGTIGRLSPVKGQKFIVEAMADLVNHIPDIEAVIIGDGPLETDLNSLARSLNLEGKVHFITSSIDTEKFLSIMDVFVFPSINEGLGLALLEALAAGKACVASDVGGIADVIQDGKTGILVPPGDWRAISGAVMELLNDRVSREDMGRNGRAVVKERFSIDLMVNGVTEVYKEVKGVR